MTSTGFASPDATSRTPDAKWQYIYAIIPSEDTLVFEVEGLEPERDVYTVNVDGLAAVTSRIERSTFVGMERAEAMAYLAAHQRVVDTVLQDSTALPVKFGTTLPNEQRIVALLRQNASTLRESLNWMADKEQLEVVVMWDLGQVLGEIGKMPEVETIKQQVAALPAEEHENGRVLVGRLVHGLLQQRRAAVSAQIVEILRAAAEDIVVNPLMDDTMVANLALLVRESGREAFDERLDRLDQQFDGQLQIRCVGPLAPYSFATVEVKALDFAEVDTARRLLELEAATSLDAIKRSYRRLAAQAHPDRNPDDPEAGSRMDRLNGAYRLLSEVAEIQPGDNQDSICQLDQATVEETLVARIERQEVGA
jgi:DnaJ-domain-containing protein 1